MGFVLTVGLLLIFALFSAPSLEAQSLLPPSLGAWTSTDPITTSADKVESLAGAAAPYLREYGLVGAERRTYLQAGYVVEVTAYQMLDATAAFGAFTLLRGDSMKSCGFAEFCAISLGSGLLLSGRAVLRLSAEDAAALQSVLQLLAVQSANANREATYPTLPSYLPTQGLVEGSERFALGPLALERFFPTRKGDWPAFHLGAEAVVARYRLGDATGVVVIVAYPSHIAAKQQVDALRGMFNVNGADVPESKRLPIIVRRSRCLLAIAAHFDSREMAERLLSRVNYQETLTINEPGFRATERPIITAIYTIIVLIGVLMCFAMVAGLAFGGVRLAVKRALPGRFFDRESAIEILQLGLYSKPIEAKDFYLPAHPSGKN
jgi:hypothetical protein